MCNVPATSNATSHGHGHARTTHPETTLARIESVTPARSCELVTSAAAAFPMADAEGFSANVPTRMTSVNHVGYCTSPGSRTCTGGNTGGSSGDRWKGVTSRS